MCKKGFQMISHSFFENRQWKGDAFVTYLYMWLLDGATEKRKHVHGVELNRGQLLTSINNICLITKLSSTSVKNSLKKLKESGEISEEIKPNKYRIITIIHYEENTSGGATVGFSKTNNKTNSKTNNKTTYKKDKKITSVCALQAHTHKKEETAKAPRSLEERAHAVTFEEMRQYQIENRLGGGELVTEFYDAFHDSKTKIPDDWKNLYYKYAKADLSAQIEFVEKLKRGEYRDKWGAADG